MSDLRYTSLDEYTDGLAELRSMVAPTLAPRLHDVLYALVEFALRDHAHELAEKIRNRPFVAHYGHGTFDEGSDSAADLIDPEVPR